MEKTNKESILCFDEDLSRLNEFSQLVGDVFNVIPANTFPEAFKILNSEDIKAIVAANEGADLGSMLLKLVLRDHPLIARFLINTSTDVYSLVSLLNEAKISCIFCYPFKKFKIIESISSEIRVFNIRKVDLANVENLKKQLASKELKILQQQKYLDFAKNNYNPLDDDCKDFLINNMLDCVAHFNVKGEIIYKNSSFEEKFGALFSKSNSQESIQDVIFFEQKIKEAFKRNMDLKFDTSWEINGHKTYVSWNLKIFRDNAGNSQIVIASGYNNTRVFELMADLENMKAKAEESDRLKNAFLSNLGHELRTPIHNIIGFIDVLATENLDQEDKVLYSSIVKNNCNQLLKLMNDIIDVSKIEAGVTELNIQECEVNSMLLDIQFQYYELAVSKNLFLEVDTPGDGLFIIQADELKLRHVLLNLLDNAFKYTKSGGVSFGYKTFETIAVFYVTDTGIGIPHDSFELIFQHFRQADSSYSRNFDGAGLGLAIAKSFIELHGGRIWLESELGKGTTFYCSIPIVL